jgi:GNAT superfamily N-acetyltransferase
MGNKVLLSSFKEEIKILENGDFIMRSYYDTDKLVSRINYNKSTGQVGLLLVTEDYRRKSLGTQMILKACQEIDADEIWGVTKDHPFYRNTFSGIIFKYRSPIKPYLSENGFYAKKSDLFSG